MNVLIVSYFNSWITHFATELEIAQKHLDRGDRVFFLACDSSLKYCEANPQGSVRRCDRCRLRRTRSLGLLSGAVTEFRLGDFLPESTGDMESAAMAEISGIHDAENFVHNGHDLGNAALSSAIWNARDPLCETEQSLGQLRRYVVTALRSYIGVSEFLRQHPSMEAAYVFNGRFASSRGALRACQETAGLEVYTHERGANIGKYMMFRNEMVHSRALWTSEILRTWNSSGEAERMESGASFFESRRRGANKEWVSYIGRQTAGKLPASWNPDRTNVVIFNSSEDEFVGLGEEWKNPIYESQSEGIGKIIRDCQSLYPEMRFYLRVHPNLIGVINRDMRQIRGLAKSDTPNLEVIDPESDVCTYSLIDACSKSLTFGSTTGVEATYWGKVSILAGHSFYGDLDAAYRVGSHAELVELLGKELVPKPKVNAIKYGHYLMTFGEDFVHWKATDFSNGLFKGQSLKREPRSLLVRRLMVAYQDLRRRG